MSLPTRNTIDDPYEKAGRHSSNGSPNGSTTSIVDSVRDAYMTPSQTARYFRAGGLCAFIVILFFVFGPGREYVSGK